MLILEASDFKDIIYLSYCIILSTSFMGNFYGPKVDRFWNEIQLEASQDEMITLRIRRWK